MDLVRLGRLSVGAVKPEEVEDRDGDGGRKNLTPLQGYYSTSQSIYKEPGSKLSLQHLNPNHEKDIFLHGCNSHDAILMQYRY